jgi:hypothetical protein
MIAIMQPLQSVQMPIIKIKNLLCSPLTTLPNQSNAAQTLEDPHFEEPESQQFFFDCITQVRHQHIHLFARQLKDYSNGAHLSAVMAANQYSETLLQNQDDEVPDYEPSDDDDELSRL